MGLLFFSGPLGEISSRSIFGVLGFFSEPQKSPEIAQLRKRGQRAEPLSESVNFQNTTQKIHRRSLPSGEKVAHEALKNVILAKIALRGLRANLRLVQSYSACEKVPICETSECF